MGRRLLILHCGENVLNCGVFHLGRTLCWVGWQAMPLDLTATPTENSKVWAAAIASATRKLPSTWCRAEIVVIPAGVSWLTKGLKVPVVDVTRQEQTLAYEVAQSLPYPLAQVLWAAHSMKRDTVEMESLLVAGLKDAPLDLYHALSNRGMAPTYILAPPLLDFNSYKRMRTPGEENTLLLNLDESAIYLSLVAGEQVTARTIPIRITNDPFETASTPVIRKLTAEILRSLAAHKHAFPEYAPKRLLIAGNTARIPGLIEALEGTLQLTVSPFEVMQTGELTIADNAGVPLCTSESWAHAMIGAAMGIAGQPGTIGLNLLPNALIRAITLKRKLPYLMAAAACAALSGCVLYYGQLCQQQHLIEALYQGESELRELEANASRVQNALHTIELSRQELTTMEALQTARSAWPNFLSDLQNRLGTVEDVWLDGFEIQPNTTSPTKVAKQTPAEPLRIQVTGRMVDRANPLMRVSTNGQIRINALLDNFAQSPCVLGLEHKRFDPSENGILRFGFVLMLKPTSGL